MFWNVFYFLNVIFFKINVGVIVWVILCEYFNLYNILEFMEVWFFFRRFGSLKVSCFFLVGEKMEDVN